MNTTPEPEADIRPQASSPAPENRSEGGAQGAAEKQPAQASATGGQIAEESKGTQCGQITGETVGNIGQEGGQASDDGMNTNDDQGGQIARVISPSSAHPNSNARVGDAATPANPTPDDAIWRLVHTR